ncbi:low temperature requirement protein A [Kribbella sp. CA-293567]|uniref:low temperature requirement protein A n=1 Tax=Kribbella sp. CA-293567 TaxID=3002436 RepID=UPI0022DD61D4|nr:low temperature requirement protein A [Kribbella sp. CA-293567]WBQ03631.1 low temperature requirement protein A [Kribbella sp. CA-293567]
MQAAPISARMRPRGPDEQHRSASPLELLFDLTFVVAVAAAAAELAHSLADGHYAATGFLQVFFAIWWAWMNFTWFATAYDTDDVAYRLLTMVQMGGVLVLAAGVPAAAADADFRVVTLGYLLMRGGQIVQWLRAAVEDREGRRTALRNAAGISVLQAGWLIRLATGETTTLTFVCLAVLELTVPWWAQRKGDTGWHPHHVAERYGLFTIILLGESVLAVSNAVRATEVSLAMVVVAAGGLLLLFSLWWLYFVQPAGAGLAANRDKSFVWGYGHYGLFATLAALGAGLEVAVEQTSHSLPISPTAAGFAIAVPVALFVGLLWVVNRTIAASLLRLSTSVAAMMLIGLAPLLAPYGGVPLVVVLVAVVCVLVVAVTLVQQTSPGRRSDRPESDAG